ncbi:MAG: bifunctional 4-hydroxy-2-oxoglutarate aldolase/2-dehydro-3-deoxy-phosphogluconate aldolase [Bacteroidota bacterium]
MDRLKVLQALTEGRLIPLFYHPDPDTAFQIATACYRGGARVIEFTNRGPFAHEVFASLRKQLWKELPDMLLGVGSVQDSGTAALYIQMGTDFVVTPLLRTDVISTCNRRKVAVIPGVSTSSEIGLAEEKGCELVKITPGDVLGPAFLKAHLAPCPWTRAMISGGVTPDESNLKAWFQAGAACVGMGSKLITADIIERRDWTALEQNVRRTVELIGQI